MNEATGASNTAASLVNSSHPADVVAAQLESMLSAGNYDGVKTLLQPVQPVDIAEAIGRLPLILQALVFRLLKKNEAIEVYEYLDPVVQQSLLDRLRSGEVLELVEEMSALCPGLRDLPLREAWMKLFIIISLTAGSIIALSTGVAEH